MLARASSNVTALLLAACLTGCASDGVSSFRLPWSRQTSASNPMSVAPDYNRSIDDYRRDYAQREIVSPGFGLEARPDPGPLKRAGTAISTSAVGQAVSSTFRKTTEKVSDAVADVTTLDKNTRPSDSLSLDRPARPSANFYVSVAKLQARSGNIPGAIQQFEKALEVDPKDLHALLGLARLYDQQEQLEKATELYQRAVKAHPQEAGALNDLGLCYARRGMLPASRDTLKKAVELRPDRALYRNNLATVLVELGDVEQAVQQLASVHGRAVAHYNVGYLLHSRHRNSEALGQFEMAIALDPSFAAAREMVAQLSGTPATGLAGHTSPMPHASALPSAPAETAAPGPSWDAGRGSENPWQRPTARRDPPSSIDPPARYNEPRMLTPPVPPTPDEIPAYRTRPGDEINLVPDVSRAPRAYPPSRF